MSYITFKKTDGTMYDGKSEIKYNDFDKFFEALEERIDKNISQGNKGLEDVDFPDADKIRPNERDQLFFRLCENQKFNFAFSWQMADPQKDFTKSVKFINDCVTKCTQPGVGECEYMKNFMFGNPGYLWQRHKNALQNNMQSDIGKFPTEAFHVACLQANGKELENVLRLDDKGMLQDRTDLTDKIMTSYQTESVFNKLNDSLDKYPDAKASNAFMLRMALQSDMSTIPEEKLKEVENKFDRNYPGMYKEILNDVSSKVVARVAKETNGKKDIENNTGIDGLADKAKKMEGMSASERYAFRIKELRGTMTTPRIAAQKRNVQNSMNNVAFKNLGNGGR